MDTTDDAALEISRWTRPDDTVKARRLRKIERFRYRQWLASFDVEPGKLPYGVGS